MIINGHSLNVEITGPEDGLPVVLLHHGLGSVRAWKEQVPALAAAGYRVIAYDRWGYGQSAPRSELDIPTFQADQADLDALLKALDLQDVCLVGHSDGGTIALAYVSGNPWRVSTLVSIAAHAFVEPKMALGIMGVRQNFRADSRFQEGLRRIHGEKTNDVFQHWFNGWMRSENLTWDLRPALAQIQVPALIVQGLADEHATPYHAEAIAGAIQGARLWLAPDAHHMLPQELTEPFNQRLLAFLKKTAHA